MENGLGTGVGAQGPGRKSSQSWEDPACRLAEGVFGPQGRDSGHLSLWQGEDVQPSPSLTTGLVGRPVNQTPSDSSGRLHQWIISHRVESKTRIPLTDELRVTHPEDRPASDRAGRLQVLFTAVASERNISGLKEGRINSSV